MSTSKKIARTSAMLICVSSFGYLLGMLKEIMVADFFGISRAMDAFYAALTLPMLMNNVLMAVFSAVFIPVYIKYGATDKDEASRIASAVINLLCVVLAAAALILWIFAPVFIETFFPRFSGAAADQAAYLLRILSLTIILSGLAGAMTGIINAHKRFFWPAVSQIFITVATMFFIFFLARSAGVSSMAYGMCAGLFCQCLFLVPVTGRLGYRHNASFLFGHPELGRMLGHASIYFIAIIAGQVNVAVDMVMASYLSPGSIAALGYGGKLVQVPIMIFTGAIATAVYPFFSAHAAQGEIAEMKESFARSIRGAACIFIPITAAIVVFARPVVALLFQRGAFDVRATDITSSIFICYSFQLVFYTVGLISIKAFLSLREMGVLARVAVMGMVLNVFLNLLLMRLIAPPVAGIALATSAVQVAVMCVLLRSLRNKLGSFNGAYVMGGAVRALLSSLAGGAVAFLALRYLHGAFHGPGIGGRIAGLAIAFISGGAVFMILALATGLEEARQTLAVAGNRLRLIFTRR